MQKNITDRPLALDLLLEVDERLTHSHSLSRFVENNLSRADAVSVGWVVKCGCGTSLEMWPFTKDWRNSFRTHYLLFRRPMRTLTRVLVLKSTCILVLRMLLYELSQSTCTVPLHFLTCRYKTPCLSSCASSFFHCQQFIVHKLSLPRQGSHLTCHAESLHHTHSEKFARSRGFACLPCFA